MSKWPKVSMIPFTVFIRHERYGLAAAYATLIFLILLAYSLITNRVAKGAEGTFK